MPKGKQQRIDRLDRAATYAHTLVSGVGPKWSPMRIWKRSQGIARTYGLPNWRDHTTCLCQLQKGRRMPKQASKVPGSRESKTSTRVEFLGEDGKSTDFATLLTEWAQPESEYHQLLIAKGLELTEGDDYRLVDSDGNVAHMKSAPEKVRMIIARTVAELLNCPATITLPDNGQTVAVSQRNWVAFRAKVEAPFPGDGIARAEYINKNGGNVIVPTVQVEDNDETEAAELESVEA